MLASPLCSTPVLHTLPLTASAHQTPQGPLPFLQNPGHIPPGLSTCRSCHLECCSQIYTRLATSKSLLRCRSVSPLLSTVPNNRTTCFYPLSDPRDHLLPSSSSLCSDYSPADILRAFLIYLRPISYQQVSCSLLHLQPLGQRQAHRRLTALLDARWNKRVSEINPNSSKEISAAVLFPCHQMAREVGDFYS